MSTNKKPVSIIAIIIASIVVSSIATVVAVNSGALNFFGIGKLNNAPLINGTIVNQDNKTYGILIVPSNANVTIPPVNNTPPPVVNNTPPAPTCGEGTHLENNVCVPNTPPVPTCKADEIYNATLNECVAKPKPPTPTPTPTAFTFTVTGDIDSSSAGTSVFNKIKSENAKYDIVLGDLGYDSNLAWFKSTYGTLGDKMFCVIGNHDAPEDGSSTIYAEAQKYCGDAYWVREGSTLFMLFNTNGDLNLQGTNAGKLLQNTTFMNGVKNLFVFSHKPCAVSPNAHHAVESKVKTFCDSLKTKVPSTVKQHYIQAHNHVMSESADKVYTTIGAGGRSHYTCGTSAAFPFCDNVHYGYLKVTVAADGTVTQQFFDYNGKVVK